MDDLQKQLKRFESIALSPPPLSSPTPNSLANRDLSPLPNEPGMSKIMEAFQEIANLKVELKESQEENKALRDKINQFESRQQEAKSGPSHPEHEEVEAEPEQVQRSESEKSLNIELVTKQETGLSASPPAMKEPACTFEATNK